MELAAVRAGSTCSGERGTVAGGLRKSSNTILVVAIKLRVFVLQVGEFWQVVDHDVGLVGMVLEVVLVVILGGVEGLERDDLGDDELRINFCRVELRNVGFGDFLLLLVRIEDGRAILSAVVRALAV